MRNYKFILIVLVIITTVQYHIVNSQASDPVPDTPPGFPGDANFPPDGGGVISTSPVAPVNVSAAAHNVCGGIIKLTFDAVDPYANRYKIYYRAVGQESWILYTTLYTGAKVSDGDPPGAIWEDATLGTYGLGMILGSDDQYLNTEYEFAVVSDHYDSYRDEKTKDRESSKAISAAPASASPRCDFFNVNSSGICGTSAILDAGFYPYIYDRYGWSGLQSQNSFPSGWYDFDDQNHYAPSIYTGFNNSISIKLYNSPSQRLVTFQYYAGVGKSSVYSLESNPAVLTCGYAATTEGEYCGTASGQVFSETPTADLCQTGATASSVGTATSTFGSPYIDYKWSCKQGNYASTCFAQQTCPECAVLNASCSTQTDICLIGDFQDEEDTPTENKWSCLGDYGTSIMCSSVKNPPVNGACGYTSDQYFESLPLIGYLCQAGQISPAAYAEFTEQEISDVNIPSNPDDNDYKYGWQCLGTGGGQNTSCTVITEYKYNSINNRTLEGVTMEPALIKDEATDKCYIKAENEPQGSSCVVKKSGQPYQSTEVPEGYPVGPGEDYMLVCTVTGETATEVYSSPKMRCLLNPDVKEI